MFLQRGRSIICIIIVFFENNDRTFYGIVIVFKISTQFIQSMAKQSNKNTNNEKTGSYSFNRGSVELAAGIFVLDSEIRPSRVL